MNERKGNEVAGFERSMRRNWALIRIAETLGQARTEGWIDGKGALPTVKAAAILAAGEQQLAGQSTPMRALQSGLGLGTVEMDVLWMLAGIELDPSMSRAAQLLVPQGATGECQDSCRMSVSC